MMKTYTVQATFEIEAETAADAISRVESLNRSSYQGQRGTGATEVMSIDRVAPTKKGGAR